MVKVNRKLLLPSDSSLRIDAKMIIEEMWEESEQAKQALEEVQRADKRARDRTEKARQEQM